MKIFRCLFFAGVLAALVISCGTSNSDPCGDYRPCAPDSEDFRYTEKHVPIPTATPTEITVGTMLSWPQQPVPTAATPRTGRELQLFHISKAFVQAVWLQPTDCDIHMEIADTPNKSAPRVIIETPRDAEFCPQRKQEMALIS